MDELFALLIYNSTCASFNQFRVVYILGLSKTQGLQDSLSEALQ